MSYILAEIPEDGMIRCEAIDRKQAYQSYRGQSPGIKKIVHKETVGLDKLDGVRVFSRLDSIKSEWSGPESDEAILKLDDAGAIENIWMADSQRDRLTNRLKRWAGCYGGYAIRRLNT